MMVALEALESIQNTVNFIDNSIRAQVALESSNRGLHETVENARYVMSQYHLAKPLMTPQQLEILSLQEDLISNNIVLHGQIQNFFSQASENAPAPHDYIKYSKDQIPRAIVNSHRLLDHTSVFREAFANLRR